MFPAEATFRWLLAGAVTLALGLRVYRLSFIPVAGDESVYMRWAEIILDQKQWFISLLDGKQPLSYWLYAMARVLWPSDPLLSARMISALAGALSTLGIFAIGRRLAGDTAGLLAALGYAFFPYALLYDRLAYTEALVNLAGVAIAYTSIRCFDGSGTWWKRALAPGLALGLGFFTKSTALLFGFFPVLAGLWLARQNRQELVKTLGAIYGVALIFPLIAWAAVPSAPMMETHSLVLHQTSFFVSPSEFMGNPFVAAPSNIRLLGAYTRAYVTLPLALAGLASLAYLVYKRSTAALVISSALWAPLLVQVFVLEKMFPTRYPFAHWWPLFILLAMACTALPWPGSATLKNSAAALVFLVITGPAIAKGISVLRDPERNLYLEDSRTFLGSGPAAGYGIREASDFLLGEASKGPMVVFTDAIWGPPADAMFAYLNERKGIRVYEAWWTSIAPNYPILPPAPVEVVKSQYERVAAGVLDPRTLQRVYYVTENFYTPPDAVRHRQPQAERVASFPKPNGRESIDVYRLR